MSERHDAKRKSAKAKLRSDGREDCDPPAQQHYALSTNVKPLSVFWNKGTRAVFTPVSV